MASTTVTNFQQRATLEQVRYLGERGFGYSEPNAYRNEYFIANDSTMILWHGDYWSNGKFVDADGPVIYLRFPDPIAAYIHLQIENSN